MNFKTVEELASAVNDWCQQNQVSPASGQASNTTTARTVRYYRSQSLVDAPLRNSEEPYDEKHYLQLIAVRLLQAKGLPLSRIQELLIGRKITDLRRIQKQGLKEIESTSSDRLPALSTSETWRMIPLNEDWLIASRRDRALSPEQISAIRAILTPTPTNSN
ncbi:MerR family transcriptional regulator [Pelagicoccus mobilis]|uniref:MerR family transcriptional regulator n=1 Tax=Pelagicoccus mobilis TaxID=415221 RepID=A0A934VTN3_9BACT|nr:MerR family transcriptional regulator [Pelagicoccus mobilis]MBK1879694.1 MerR family transcriptional regulator [Pelagicoccus mobilis]